MAARIIGRPKASAIRLALLFAAALVLALGILGCATDDGQQRGSVTSPAPSAVTTADPSPAPAPEYSYVVNTNTGKFHRPSCGDVAKIKPENREDVTTSRDELIAQGYEPCKHCNP